MFGHIATLCMKGLNLKKKSCLLKTTPSLSLLKTPYPVQQFSSPPLENESKVGKDSQLHTYLFNLFMHNVVKWPNILWKSCSVHTAKFLNYDWQFFNILYEKVKWSNDKWNSGQLENFSINECEMS